MNLTVKGKFMHKLGTSPKWLQLEIPALLTNKNGPQILNEVRIVRIRQAIYALGQTAPVCWQEVIGQNVLWTSD